jgi:hypothetical protein
VGLEVTMRVAVVALALSFAAPASAGVMLGLDGDVAIALGDSGTGGVGPGGAIRIGAAPPPLTLGPMALGFIPELQVDAHKLDRVGEEVTIGRVVVGARMVLTLLWLHDKPDEGESLEWGQGVRLDTGVYLHGGIGYSSAYDSLPGTGDLGAFVDLGFGPIGIGVHAGVGMFPPENREDLGTAWVNAGGHAAVYF